MHWADALGRRAGPTRWTDALDLREYSCEKHDIIVLDNINDQKFVLDNRAVLQANNDIHTLGESRTGIYSYSVWLWRVPIVLTVDDRAKWDSEDAWVKENCFEVRLTGPSWQLGPRGSPARPLPVREHEDIPAWPLPS